MMRFSSRRQQFMPRSTRFTPRRARHRLPDGKSSKPAASASPSAAQPHAPRITSAVRRLLEGIGTPEAHAFTPDAFQREALARIKHEDLLVTAPTGSGKTWIAREEIRRLLSQGKQAWYTSPLKALTNSKYLEFAREFGSANVGILTGDRKENSSAPLIIGTTEVFRNQLFDSLRGGEGLRSDLVILDEAHYMGDEERGHVWEEAIILTPPRVRLLLLSATVGNADELARWIEDVRGTSCGVITREFIDTDVEVVNNIGIDKKLDVDREVIDKADAVQTSISLSSSRSTSSQPIEQHRSGTHLTTEIRSARPVPLRAAFMFDDGSLAPLQNSRGEFNDDITRYLQRLKSQAGFDGRNTGAGWRAANGRRQTTARAPLPAVEPAAMIDSLAAHNLLPAIVFLPTRRRCDEAATEAAHTAAHARTESPKQLARRHARKEFLDSFIEQHPELKKHRHVKMVLRTGLAAHHAGHLPMWKVAIEEMMSRGLLDAIFATSTVAAGVDFPARTVVLTVADARSNHGWRALSASEFSQMTGRAGRRGKDNVGFIIAASGAHQKPQLIYQLLHAPIEPLASQFRATYTTLLNLLDAYGSFQALRDVVERSFAFRAFAAKIQHLERDIERRENFIAAKLKQADFMRADFSTVRALERLAAARTHLLEAAPHTRAENFYRFLDDHAVPLRVISLGRSGRRLIFLTERRGARLAGVREDGSRAAVSLDRIGRIYSKTYASIDDAARAFQETYDGVNTPLAEPRFRTARLDTEEAVELINDLIQRLADDALQATFEDKRANLSAQNNNDERIAHINGDKSIDDETPDSESRRRKALQVLWSLVEEAEAVERERRRIEVLRAEVWQPFAERAKVLAAFGYLDYAHEQITLRGRWLADLRVDRPLLIGEGLAANLFEDLSVPSLAGLAAALAADGDRDYGELPLTDSLIEALAKFERVADKVAQIEWQHSIEPAPDMNYSAAAAAARWASGTTWNNLVKETNAEEGDLFRMLSRTGESLLQIARLEETHPRAAERARHAALAVLRAPVRDD